MVHQEQFSVCAKNFTVACPDIVIGIRRRVIRIQIEETVIRPVIRITAHIRSNSSRQCTTPIKFFPSEFRLEAEARPDIATGIRRRAIRMQIEETDIRPVSRITAHTRSNPTGCIPVVVAYIYR